MPRQRRIDEGGTIYHALNRGNARRADGKASAVGHGDSLVALSCSQSHARRRTYLSVAFQELSSAERHSLLCTLSIRRTQSSSCQPDRPCRELEVWISVSMEPIRGTYPTDLIAMADS